MREAYWGVLLGRIERRIGDFKDGEWWNLGFMGGGAWIGEIWERDIVGVLEREMVTVDGA